MRTITAAQRAAIAALRAGHFSRFRVQDADGVYRDYTQYLRTDWFTGASISENIDTNTMQLNATLLRETGTLSLSPFRSDSLVNRNAGGSYATAIDAWRKWDLSIAVMREGYPPTGTDWIEMCQGRIDVIEWSGDQIQITGRGEEAVLLDFYIATPRAYGSIGGILMETVLQSMNDNNLLAASPTLYTPVSPSYLMNPWVQPKGNLFPADVVVASKAGAVIRYRYDASDVNRLTLFKPNRTAVPGNEVWTLGADEITAYQRVAVDKQGIRNFIKLRFAHPTLGVQTVIYPHMAGTGTVVCTAGAATFSNSQAGIIKSAADNSNTEIIVDGVPYTVTAFDGSTSATLLSQPGDPSNGIPVPTFSVNAFTLHDTLSGAGTTPSLSRFGRADMELDLSFDTQVTDPTNAQGMCDAVGSDTEFPDLEQQIETLGAWFIQLHDYGKFEANGVHYDSPQYGGVTSIRHDIADATIKTTIGIRGKPSGGYMRWRELAGASRFAPAPTPPTLSASFDTTGQLLINSAGDPSTTSQKIAWGTGGIPSVATVRAATPIAQQNVSGFATGSIYPVGPVVVFIAAFAYNARGIESPLLAATGLVREVGGSSTPPTPLGVNLFTYNSGGATSGQMWLCWSWSAFLIYQQDGTTIAVPASSSLPTPPSPTLGQVAGGILAGRTRFVRVGYTKNSLIYRVGAEASFAVGVNNLLKVTSPGAVAGYDGWCPLVGSATNTEFMQSSGFSVAFGTDWTEPTTGADLSGQTPFDVTQWPNAVTAWGLNASSTFFHYPWWEIATSLVGFGLRGQTVKSASLAQTQLLDGHIALSLGALSGATSGAGTPGNGSPVGGKYL